MRLFQLWLRFIFFISIFWRFCIRRVVIVILYSFFIIRCVFNIRVFCSVMTFCFSYSLFIRLFVFFFDFDCSALTSLPFLSSGFLSDFMLSFAISWGVSNGVIIFHFLSFFYLKNFIYWISVFFNLSEYLLPNSKKSTCFS